MAQSASAVAEQKARSRIKVSEGDAIGRCPGCGPVVRDSVDLRFPNPAKCARCGEELEKATVASHDAEINRSQATEIKVE
jgi:predicted RNA-binding Zn-ribbon protein involved in translation (DUF1610 family)